MTIMISKIRTVNINSRGQIVIPEEFRKDLNIKGGETLVLVERSGEITIKRENALSTAL